MFLRRIWILKQIGEESTYKVEYGKMLFIVCLFIFMYIYVKMLIVRASWKISYMYLLYVNH